MFFFAIQPTRRNIRLVLITVGIIIGVMFLFTLIVFMIVNSHRKSKIKKMEASENEINKAKDIMKENTEELYETHKVNILA